MKHSKRMRANLEIVAKNKRADLPTAVSVLQSTKPAKFDETVEIAVRLGIDTKRSDHTVRGAVSLPNGVGRESRVIAFARGEQAEKARLAGALEVGAEELAAKIQGGWMEFDVVIASPDMMGVVGRLGKVLGPQGKMPTPKSGTVSADVSSAVREFRAGKVTVRADAAGIVHAPVGKRSFPASKLVENVDAMLHYIRSLRPATSKGNYFLSVALSTTMGPSVHVEGV